LASGFLARLAMEGSGRGRKEMIPDAGVRRRGLSAEKGWGWG
jgi:hypothetical protein